MTDSRTPPIEADAQESVRRLVDLIQVLLPTRPTVIEAIERCVLALVVTEMRQRITDRLRRFTPEEISTVEALTAHLAQQRRRTASDARRRGGRVSVRRPRRRRRATRRAQLGMSATTAALARAVAGELLGPTELAAILRLRHAQFHKLAKAGAFEHFKVRPVITPKCYSGVLITRWLAGEPVYEPTFGRKRR
jgi:hypothetical protein